MTDICHAAEQVKTALFDELINPDDPRYGPDETKALQEHVFDNPRLWIGLSRKLEQRFYERALTVAQIKTICNTLRTTDTQQYCFNFSLTLKNSMRQVETLTTQLVVTNGVGEPPELFSLVMESELKKGVRRLKR